MNRCIICINEIEKEFCFLTCNCNNIYHNKCINKWLAINKKCPTCNHIFKDFNNSNIELLNKAIFYNSIGRFDIFRTRCLNNITN